MAFMNSLKMPKSMYKILIAVLVIASLWSLMRMMANSSSTAVAYATPIPTRAPAAMLESYDLYDEDSGREGMADYMSDEEEEEGYGEEDDEESYGADEYSDAQFSPSLL
jgi:hypothetical protein